MFKFFSILIMLVSIESFAQEIKLYFVESKLSFIKRSTTEYVLNYKVKEFSLEDRKFLEESFCNSCSSPDFLAFAPEKEWFFAIETDKKDKDDNSLKLLKEHFELKPAGRYQGKDKKEFRFFSMMSQKTVEPKKEESVGIKIFQRDGGYSKTITLPPTENFTILNAFGVNSKGDKQKLNNIKITSSCGIVSYDNSSQFRFTLPENKMKCTIYATLGSFSDEIEIMRKDNTPDSYQFDITFNNEPLDELKITYSTLKKGIKIGYISKIKPEWRGNHLKFSEKDGFIEVKSVKKQSEYILEMLYPANNLKDTLKIIITPTEKK